MILAVTGGKGGVGKSTVAYNLAAELDGVVVDADLGMADLPVSRGPDLHDVLAGRAAPLEAVCESTPVAILPCGRSLSGARAVDPTRLCAAVETVERAYGIVVVDCPAGLRADAGLPLVVASACVVVTTPSEAAIADAMRARELARKFDAGLVRVVVNRAGESPPTERVADRFGARAVPIPDADRVERAQSAGQPLRSIAPESVPRKRFRDLARAVQSCNV